MSIGGRVGTGRAQLLALIVGAAGLAACAVAWLSAPNLLLPAYLVGFLFWWGIALGCLAVIMLHQLVGGEWGVPVRRLAEAGASTIPLLAVFFLPIVFGLNSLYRWTDTSAVRHSEDLRRKASYLNPQAFEIRAAGYFVVWSILAFLMTRWSRRSERADADGIRNWMAGISGPGLLIYFMTVTFSSIDWMMSREPDWASTIYGPMVVIGQGLSALAALILLASLFARRGGDLRLAASPDRLNDLGNLLLAFVMLWAYMAFSQFLIIWSGNLTEEIPWYLRRTSGGWKWVSIGLIAFHFAAPFVVLLFRESKRRREILMGVAAFLLVVHVVDIAWLVLPASADPKVGHSSWTDLPLVAAAVAGIGGIWLAALLWFLGSAPIVPARDPSGGDPIELGPAEAHA